jgi:hypothetical protein
MSENPYDAPQELSPYRWPEKQKSAATRNFLFAVAIGALLSCGWFVPCAWIGSLPVISPVSLSLAFQPWWRYWGMGVILLFAPWLWMLAHDTWKHSAP